MRNILAFLGLAALLILGGCVTSGTNSTTAAADKAAAIAKAESAAKTTFDKLCSAEPLVYTAFQVYAASGKVSAKTVERVSAVDAAFRQTCLNPPTSFVQALLSASSAYAQVYAALHNTPNPAPS